MDTVANVELQMVRTLKAPPDRVYAAWTDPSLAAKWFGPGEMTAKATISPKVGGRYRVEMTDPAGEAHIVGGEYKELVPGKRIVKTWQWEGSDVVTEVAVDLRESAPGVTELTLTHTRFADTDARDKHEQGWGGCFAKLEAMYR